MKDSLYLSLPYFNICEEMNFHIHKIILKIFLLKNKTLILILSKETLKHSE